MTQTRKPKCIMLVGLPASGKSTWTENNILLPIASSDAWVEKLAAASGRTYGEAFQDVIKEATRLFDMQLNELIYAKRDFVWDQTNLTVKSRKGKLARLKDYDVECHVWEISDEEHARRIASRPEKVIPAHVMQSMKSTYQQPSFEEGFIDIVIHH